MAYPFEKTRYKLLRSQRWFILLIPAAVGIILLALSFKLMSTAYATGAAVSSMSEPANAVPAAVQQLVSLWRLEQQTRSGP